MKFKPDRKSLRRFIGGLIAGAAIVAAIYFLLKFNGDYETPYEMFDVLGRLLAMIWIVGGVIALQIYANKRIIWKGTVPIFVVFVAWCMADRALDKRIYLVNFSKTPKSVTVDGRRYTLMPGSDKELFFCDRDIRVDHETLRHRGAYVVNLAHPKKFLRYGIVQHVSLNGVSFDIKPKMFELSEKKITQLADNPRAVIQKLCSLAWKDSLTFCVKGVDAKELVP